VIVWNPDEVADEEDGAVVVRTLEGIVWFEVAVAVGVVVVDEGVAEGVVDVEDGVVDEGEGVVVVIVVVVVVDWAVTQTEFVWAGAVESKVSVVGI